MTGVERKCRELNVCFLQLESSMQHVHEKSAGANTVAAMTIHGVKREIDSRNAISKTGCPGILSLALRMFVDCFSPERIYKNPSVLLLLFLFYNIFSTYFFPKLRASRCHALLLFSSPKTTTREAPHVPPVLFENSASIPRMGERVSSFGLTNTQVDSMFPQNRWQEMHVFLGLESERTSPRLPKLR